MFLSNLLWLKKLDSQHENIERKTLNCVQFFIVLFFLIVLSLPSEISRTDEQSGNQYFIVMIIRIIIEKGLNRSFLAICWEKLFISWGQAPTEDLKHFDQIYTTSFITTWKNSRHS